MEGRRSQQEPVWENVLWKKQPFPDNYHDDTLFHSLAINPNQKIPALSTLLLSTLPVTQQFSSILFFVAVFVHLYNQTFSSFYFLVILPPTCLLAILCSPKESRNAWTKHFLSPSPLVLVMTLYVLAPILKTLTAATTSDSIWALSALLFTINLVLANYGLPPKPKPRLELRSLSPRSPKGIAPSSNETIKINDSETASSSALTTFPAPLSFSAAVSASTVLASRLDTDGDVFAFMLFAVVWFGLFPIWRRSLGGLSSPIPSIAVTTLLVIGTMVLLLPESLAATLLFLLASTGLTFGAPLGLLYNMKYKDEIRAPWDEAIPKF